MKNYYRLAADDGVVIHVAPSSNYVDHGFYMFSPTLFQDYYSANRWRILRHYFFQSYPDYNAWLKIYEYKPGALSAFAFSGGLNRAMCNIYIAAGKQPGATCDADVQQGMFLRAWVTNARNNDPGQVAIDKGGWAALRERLKPHVPKTLLPILMTIEAKMKTIGGVRRYLEHYKDL